MDNVKTNGANTIICRCSDVTLERIQELINSGYSTFDEIKRITRIGMGACQGKTCSLLVMREIERLTHKPVSAQFTQTTRPPIGGVRLELIAKGADEDVK